MAKVYTHRLLPARSFLYYLSRHACEGGRGRQAGEQAGRRAGRQAGREAGRQASRQVQGDEAAEAERVEVLAGGRHLEE
ncbi:hypothetical protein E2C01_088158 [Portunus trituberculatus]|uniref:Uncharacterized protein n=1 Tax=Portunus trituberculatus TaxID=210409 RepID=A0A5B7JA11_PORTR|nr:hypothetical protein [Portunus trituberculatus]